MKTINLAYIFAFLLFLVIAGCKDEETVVAAFNVADGELETGEIISFINESANANYYQWDFGDGGLSFDENPSHEYTVAGTYDVKLVAIGSAGSDSATVSIEVAASYAITIFEGEGIEGVDIYDTWSEIQSVYNSTDTVHYTYDDYLEDYGLYYHMVYYYNEGLIFHFLTETTTIGNNDPVYYIWVLEPYSGATNKGISIGSSMDDVIAAYGDPESEDEDDGYSGYWYSSKGIDFYSYDSGEVDEIDIYEAYETSSAKSAIIRDFNKKRSKNLFQRR
jgi:PKD repeat protein